MAVRAPWAVFDLDGTLADVRHRLLFLQQRPRDWDSFFQAAVDDPPLAKGIALAMETARQCELGYVTGRPERCRADTGEWLKAHGLPIGRLLMRAEGDRRPARITKLELLQQLARERPVTLVVDDDEQVNAAYESAGFRVLRADWMTAPAVLEAVQEREGRT
ncbi:phosphatase domain-containing protein [Streptomyces sp. 8N114]|uniref:phosphatase domain-containing protein n=1 Tax=Streptomyces sp. 8N114 TaxID=3457419 RepID=UPI003FD329D9